MTYILNSRQVKIINILNKSTQPITSKALAYELDCSTKTVQGEIKEINSTLENVKIDSIRGKGYILVGNVDSIIDKDDEQTNVNIDRVGYILKKILLLYKDKTLKIESLADEMYVSLSTIKNDLKEVKVILENYNLKTISKHKLGISVSGDTKNIIKCIIESSLKYKNINIEDFFSDIVASNISSIRSEILYNIHKKHIIFTDYEFNNIFNYILLSLSLEDNNNHKEFIKI